MSKFDFFGAEATDAEAFMEKQKKYAKLKRSELETMPREELVPAVTSWIESKFSDDWHDMCEKINGLPTPCLNLYCADYIAKEIIGGGFGQAFFNASRDFIGAAAGGFRALGYFELADVIEEALKIHFDGGSKKGGGSIEDFIAFSTSDEFEKPDADFRAKFDRDKFNELAYFYVMKYKKYFGEEG